MIELRIVTVAEATGLLADGALMLDVRDDQEWEAGRAPGARHVALNDLPDRLDALTKDRLIVCVCRSGARSSRAGKFLVEQGYDAVNLEGGMIQWATQNQPLEGDLEQPAII
jgi:rhodanese-related sulfurtransferase